ncbi:FtsW/RodA/SpoVE family cell cycle protein [Candidatus Latescibacterota bacterium]
MGRDSMDDEQKIDFWLLAITMILAGIGLVMVYSSSMVISFAKFGSGTVYFKKQAIHIVIGFALMMILTKLNYRGFAKFGKFFLISGLGLLGVLLIQNQINDFGVNRWLRIGSFSFQPSEIMKIVLIIFMADSISRMGDKVRSFKEGFLPLTGIILLTFSLVFLEPDLGIAGLLLFIGFYIMFVGRAKIVHLLMIIMPALVSIVFLVKNVPYMKRRWVDFINPEMAYQIKQSIISIGSGGLMGVGLGNSSQKNYFLPELHTDFVFSIFAEELGFIGTSVLLILTFFFVKRGLKIASQAPDLFGFLLASGLTMMIGIQVFVNIGVAIRLLPTTGMTLPFISYGGTSIVTSFAAVGILLNISKQGNYEMKLSRVFGARSFRKVWS